MPIRKQLTLATCNLYNLNEPGEDLYQNSKSWTEAQYKKKIDWLSRQLDEVDADVWGFQELWHHKSLEAAFRQAKLKKDYDLLVPDDHSGKIVCAAAVKKGLLKGKPEWVERFPEEHLLQSTGDDPQAPDIKVTLDGFSRPVLHFRIKPRSNSPAIDAYVCHLKSKRPTELYREAWYKADKATYSPHATALGAAISTIRRTAEASALRVLMNLKMEGANTPVVVFGDLNDGPHSNTLNILTGQPRYLHPLSRGGGGDKALYSVGTLQQLRSQRDVYYTHVHNDTRESLDHILVSEEFYDHSTDRIWAFDGMEVINDHLNRGDHKNDGTTDHGIVFAAFQFKPAK